MPSLVAKCAVLGAVTGPFFAAFFTSFGSLRDAAGIFVSPTLLFWTSITGIIFSLCFWVTGGLGNAYLREFLRDYPSALMRAIYVIYNAAGASLAFAVASFLILKLPSGIRFEVPFFRQVLVVDAIIGAVLALAIGAFARLKNQVEETQKQLREKELAVRELAVAESQAQTRALQSQINPHFFFNTLNTISALVDEDPKAARQMIGRLSDLFRYTLGCTTADAVTLAEELEFVRDYLSIEHARFRKRLRVEMPEGQAPHVRIPGLVLQPLVENAIKHGIAPLIEGGKVSVKVAPSGAGFRISVRNTAEERALPEPAAMFRPGHALENVRARLRLFTGEEEPLHFESGEDWVEFSFEARAAAV